MKRQCHLEWCFSNCGSYRSGYEISFGHQHQYLKNAIEEKILEGTAPERLSAVSRKTSFISVCQWFSVPATLCNHPANFQSSDALGATVRDPDSVGLGRAR